MEFIMSFGIAVSLLIMLTIVGIAVREIWDGDGLYDEEDSLWDDEELLITRSDCDENTDATDDGTDAVVINFRTRGENE